MRRRSPVRRTSAAPPGLHLVATPIGNLRDITLRALEVLAARRPDRLRGHPRHPQAPRPLRHRDAADALPRPQRRGGAAEAAGAARRRRAPSRWSRMPARRSISDPGFKLVRAAREAGHAVTAVPGASAVLAALAGRGPADRPVLLRRLPAAEGRASARARIAELARIPATLVLFESGPRLAAALADLADGLGRARGRGLPRADQAARGGAPRRSRGARARLRGRRRDARRDRDRDRAAGRRQRRPTPPMSTRCCASALDARLASRTRSARSPPSPAGRAARSTSARWRSRRATTMARSSARAPARWSPRGRAAGASGRVPHRPLGGEPRRGAADRQGLSHPGAALAQPGRRDRHRRAPPRAPGLRRGEGARDARRCGLVGH